MLAHNKREDEEYEGLGPEPVKQFVFKDINVTYGGGLCSIVPFRSVKINVDELRQSFQEKYNASYI